MGKPRYYRHDRYAISNAWWTVKRQAMTADHHEPVGLYLGTTSGELWDSRNGGDDWRGLVRHLPEIYSVETVGR